MSLEQDRTEALAELSNRLVFLAVDLDSAEDPRQRLRTIESLAQDGAEALEGGAARERGTEAPSRQRRPRRQAGRNRLMALLLIGASAAVGGAVGAGVLLLVT
jgi:hypothetical protein